MRIPYPANYFDPYATADRAQCTECGRWFEAGDITDVEAVPCLEYSEIYQGICLECAGERDQENNE